MDSHTIVNKTNKRVLWIFVCDMTSEESYGKTAGWFGVFLEIVAACHRFCLVVAGFGWF